MRHCSRSIPDGVIGIFHWHKPSARTSPGVDSASNRNEYQEYFLWGGEGGGGSKDGRCLGPTTTQPPSCADCLEMWEPQLSGSLRACPGLYVDCYTVPSFRKLWFTAAAYYSANSPDSSIIRRSWYKPPEATVSRGSLSPHRYKYKSEHSQEFYTSTPLRI